MAVLTVSAAGSATRRLSIGPPAACCRPRWKASSLAMQAAIESVAAGPRRTLLLPFIGTLWLFIVVRQSRRPGAGPALADRRPVGRPRRSRHAGVSVGALVRHPHRRPARAICATISAQPDPAARSTCSAKSRAPLALAVRLFGNMMSLEMAALLVLLVAGLLAPVPLLMLHIVEALVQAYIFGMLALVYIAGGMQVTSRES